MAVFLFSEPHYMQSFNLIGNLSKKLMAWNMLLGTAESCTGGLIGAMCTQVEGSSRWFGGGVIAYADSVKKSLLGVPPDVLETHGAVSLPVVRAMAEGALKALGVDVSVAVSGIAGPGGGSEAKPVGTVCFGLALRALGEQRSAGAIMPAQELEARCRHFSGNREAVRFAAMTAALEAVDTLLTALDEG